MLTLANTGYRVLTGLNAPAPGTRCTYITDLAAIRRVFVHLGRDKHVGASPRPSGCVWQVKYGAGSHLRAPATAAGTAALRTCLPRSVGSIRVPTRSSQQSEQTFQHPRSWGPPLRVLPWSGWSPGPAEPSTAESATWLAGAPGTGYWHRVPGI